MRIRRSVVAAAVGGSIWGALAGIAVGSLLGILVGALTQNFSLALDGAILGGLVIAIGGGFYGAKVGRAEGSVRAKPAEPQEVLKSFAGAFRLKKDD